MLRIFLLFFIFLTVQSQKSQNLIKNPNFESNSIWRNQADRELRDLKPPIFFKTNVTGIRFGFAPNGDYDREQGLLQSIFPNKENSLNTYKGPLVISFSHVIRNIDPQAKVFMYVSIRYVNGVLFPIWIFANTSSNHLQWKKQNVFIPFHGLIEDIQVSVGACDFFKSQPNSEVLITDTHIDRFEDENVNFKALKLKYENLKFIQRLPQVLRTEIAYFKAQLDFEKHDLTIVTQLTSERIIFLEQNLKFHKGPYSVAVYLKKPQDALYIQQVWSNNENMRKYCDLHLVFAHPFHEDDNPMSKRFSFSYPVNYLRNIARKHARTEFILYTDVDFILPSTLAENIANGKLIEYFRKFESGFKSLIILPTYMSTSVKTPASRKEALEMIKNKHISRFQYQSQEINRFDDWEKEDTPEFLDVTKHFLWSEPYFIAPRDIPLFNERFIGCGRDKLQQSVICANLGFKFIVWKQALITHVSLDGFEKSEKFSEMESICDAYPPASIGYHSFATHYTMMFEELKVGKADFENHLKQTALINAEEHHKKWVNSFEEYIDKKFPHLSLKKNKPTNPPPKKKEVPPKKIEPVTPPKKTDDPVASPQKIVDVKIIYKECESKTTMSTMTMISFLIFELFLIGSVFYCFVKKK